MNFRAVGTATTSVPFPTGQKVGFAPSVAALTLDFTAHQLRSFQNGTGGTAVAADATIASWTVDRVGGPVNTWKVAGGEILIYSRVLADTEIATITSYENGLWAAANYFVSASAGTPSDSTMTPWNQSTPFATIAAACSAAVSGITIAPRGGDIFRETQTVVLLPAQTNVTIDAGLWGTSRGSGLAYQNQGAQLKAEIRPSTAPTLTLRSGTTYACGTLTPVASISTFSNHFPGVGQFVIPGGNIRFGSQFANPNFYPAMRLDSKCISALPQYSCNVLRLWRYGLFLVNGAVSGTGGVVRLFVNTTAGITAGAGTTGNKIFVSSVAGTTEANSATENAAGFFPCTAIGTDVTNGPWLELGGTVFSNPYATSGGWGYNATTQSAPLVGMWGHDTGGFNGTANTIYVNAGIALATGDVELPSHGVNPIFSTQADGTIVRNMIGCCSWTQNWRVTTVNTPMPIINVTFSQVESYFALLDTFDTFNYTTTLVDRCIFGWAGSGQGLAAGPGDLAACHAPAGLPPGPPITTTMNVTNSLMLYGDDSGGSDLDDDANSIMANCICIGSLFVRTQQTAGTHGGGTQQAINNLMIYDPSRTVAAAPVGIQDAIFTFSVAAAPNPPHTMNIFYNTIVSTVPPAPGFIGIAKTTSQPTLNIRDNIIVGFGTGISSVGGVVNADHNSYFANTVDYVGVTPGAGDINGKDPLFNNNPLDLHLQVGSPVIAKGLAISGITNDFDSKSRQINPQPTMGAYEGLLSKLLAASSSGPAYGRTYERKELEDEEEALLVLEH